jgi:hypothetical protein
MYCLKVLSAPYWNGAHSSTQATVPWGVVFTHLVDREGPAIRLLSAGTAPVNPYPVVGRRPSRLERQAHRWPRFAHWHLAAGRAIASSLYSCRLSANLGRRTGHHLPLLLSLPPLLWLRPPLLMPLLPPLLWRHRVGALLCATSAGGELHMGGLPHKLPGLLHRRRGTRGSGGDGHLHAHTIEGRQCHNSCFVLQCERANELACRMGLCRT